MPLLCRTDFESTLEKISITNRYQSTDYFGLPYIVLEVEGEFYFAYKFQEFRDIQYFMAELDIRKDQREQMKFLKDTFKDFAGDSKSLVKHLESQNRRKFWKGFGIGCSITIGTFSLIFIINSIKNSIKNK